MLFSQISLEKGQTYANEVNAIFAETSALTAENVEQLFVEISEFLYSFYQLLLLVLYQLLLLVQYSNLSPSLLLTPLLCLSLSLSLFSLSHFSPLPQVVNCLLKP